MNVTGIGNSSTGDPASSGPAEQALGKDDFLNLLVAQLKNQDPLSPMESAEFTAQLAQFSSLEQLTNVNGTMQQLLQQQASATSTQAVNFIGKHVEADGSITQLADGLSGGCHFELAGDTAETIVYVSNAAGIPVKTIDMGGLDAGEHLAPWDGTDSTGRTLDDGLYTFEVVATDINGSQVTASPFISAEATGITIWEGETYIMSGELAIPLSSVIEVSEPEVQTEETEDEPLIEEKLAEKLDLISKLLNKQNELVAAAAENEEPAAAEAGDDTF